MLITERELFRVIARAEPFINGKVSAPEPKLRPGQRPYRDIAPQSFLPDEDQGGVIRRVRADSFSTGDGIVVALIFGLLIFCLLVH